MINVCVLCAVEFEGHGNSPAPIENVGVACEKCNTFRVVPTRIAIAAKASAEATLERLMPEGAACVCECCV